MHLGVAGLGFAVADVLQRAGGKNHRVLRHDAYALAQVLQRHLAARNAVDQEASGLRVVHAQQQLKHRGLARTAGADDGHGLAGLHIQREIGERVL